jgi:hypothetical protein
VRLYQFKESWTPGIKAASGGFRKFELYDFSIDPNQQTNIASNKNRGVLDGRWLYGGLKNAISTAPDPRESPKGK